MVLVGTYLQERRKAAGLTQEQVARRLGVVSRTVSDWEAGRYTPGFDLMARLIDLIGGKIEEAARLLLHDNSTEPVESAGIRDEADLLALVDTDVKRAALLRRIMELSDDPILIARIEGYLDRLEDEVDHPSG